MLSRWKDRDGSALEFEAKLSPNPDAYTPVAVTLAAR